MEERIRQAFEAFLERNKARVEIKTSTTGTSKELHYTINGTTHIIPASIPQVEAQKSTDIY